ncbi:MAG: EpsG family protein [Clostridia bacterium]
MVVYSIVILFVAMISLFLVNRQNATAYINGHEENNQVNFSLFGLFLIMVAFVFVTGFREEVGTDYWTYKSIYEMTKYNPLDNILNFDEPGINFIIWISYIIFDSPVTMFVISSLITTVLVLYGATIKKDNFFLIMMLYIFMGNWLNSFNAVRQCLAVAVIFAGHALAKKHWIIKYVIVVFIAMLFHQSAIVMLPILFVVQRKIDAKQIAILIIGAVVVSVLYQNIFVWLGATDNNVEYFTRQINPIRVIVNFIPFFFCLFVRNREAFFEENKFYINMALINGILVIITMYSAYLNRITLFTSIFAILLLPKAIATLDVKNRNLITVIMLLLYFIFWYVEINTSGNLLPYNFIF